MIPSKITLNSSRPASGLQQKWSQGHGKSIWLPFTMTRETTNVAHCSTGLVQSPALGAGGAGMERRRTTGGPCSRVDPTGTVRKSASRVPRVSWGSFPNPVWLQTQLTLAALVTSPREYSCFCCKCLIAWSSLGMGLNLSNTGFLHPKVLCSGFCGCSRTKPEDDSAVRATSPGFAFLLWPVSSYRATMNSTKSYSVGQGSCAACVSTELWIWGAGNWGDEGWEPHWGLGATTARSGSRADCRPWRAPAKPWP